MTGLSFIKMHGLGNDFVVVDLRARDFDLSAERIRAIADRKTGVGCDQFIALEPAAANEADAQMRIWNADGGEVDACGNASRCVGALLMAELGRDRVTMTTNAGLLTASRAGLGRVTVDMGPVHLDWREIPLAREMDTLHLDVGSGVLRDGVGVNVGNPHAVFFVDDAEAVPLSALGPVLEHDALFPERANIGACQVIDETHLRLRVWERGVGITRACGTGACAALIAAARRGRTGRAASVELDGGALDIAWNADNHVTMTGPTAISFTGELPA